VFQRVRGAAAHNVQMITRLTFVQHRLV